VPQRVQLFVLPALLGTALLLVGCTESLGPGRQAVSAPQFATAAAGGIALDQVNGTFSEHGIVLIKGFNPTNPHLGDAIIVTFFWIGSPVSGNIITSVTDRLVDGTPVGNHYTLVEFVTSGDIAMATYVATNVQNFPEGTFPSGEKILAVQATLSQPVLDGGILMSAWTGVASVEAQSLGAHHSASGSGIGATVADPGAIPVNAGALAYGVSMTNGLVGFTGPSGWTNIMTMSDPFMKGDGEYDAEFTVQGTSGTADPQWTWFFTLPSTWLASVLALNPTPPPTGDLTVTTTTTGSNLDPDGYTVTVDNAASQPIPTNGSVTFPGLATGDHSVLLSGVAGNCAVSGANPQTGTVPPGGAVTVSFAVTCAATPGRMTGGGKVGAARDFATFGFEVSAAGGELRLVQHCPDGANASSSTCAAGGFTFRGTATAGSYAPVSGSPNCRSWSGTGSARFKDVPSQNGGFSFTVNAACDNGTPGRATDFIDITIGAYHAAGYLTGGNIQLRNGG
jgi:hypothetical protein